MSEETLKLPIVIRSDLRGAQQTVQACHAMAEVARQDSFLLRHWFKWSKTVLVFKADPAELDQLRESSTLLQYWFQEPDFGNAFTAVAFQPMNQIQIDQLKVVLPSMILI